MRVPMRRHAFAPLLLLFAGSSLAHGQATIETLAGSTWVFPTNLTSASNAPLGRIASGAVDAQGNYYAADYGNAIVIQVTPTGGFHIVAGTGTSGFSGDGGPATSAQFALGGSVGSPGVVVDSAGNIYISDSANNRVRKVLTNGIVSTIAGRGNFGFSGDGGLATSASLNDPSGLALDSSGNLYIADTGNSRIRKVTPGGLITTVAGNGSSAPITDGGFAVSSSLISPTGIAVDASGNLYISDEFSRVRKVTASTGFISTFAGGATFGYSGDGGAATSALLSGPAGMAFDGPGNLYIAETGNAVIRRVSPNGVISTVAGTAGITGFSGDGSPALSALLYGPAGVSVNAAADLFIADAGNERIRKISAGVITTVAGNGMYYFTGDGGAANSAHLGSPYGVAVDPSGNVFIADSFENRIRKVSPAGIISTYAGNGFYNSTGDGGPATAASLEGPQNVAVSAAGDLYISDQSNRVRMVAAATGIITTFAGNGNFGYSGDGGPAAAATFKKPRGMAFDASGNLYIADYQNNVVRKVSIDGMITTFAGGGSSAFPGDGGPATAASLYEPLALAFDTFGNLFIGEGANDVRRVATNGIISTVAENNTLLAPSGDGGPATSAGLRLVAGVAVDASGNLFISDSNRVRKVSTLGVISTAAGGGTAGIGDGGPATSAQLIAPSQLAFDAAGDLLIADTDNSRIRKVIFPKLSFTTTPSNFTFTAVEGSTPVPQSIQIGGTPADPWQAAVTTVSGGEWLSASPAAGLIPASSMVLVDATNLTAGTYQGTVTIQDNGSPPASMTLNVTLNVTAAPAGQLTVTPLALSVPAQAGGTNPPAQTLSIGNSGSAALSATLSWTAVASTENGGNWLSVSPSAGSSTLHAPSTVQVSFNIQGLQPGLYSGQVAVGTTGIRVPVTLLISPAVPSLALSQTALFGNSVPGGSVNQQTISVLNTGPGNMSWAASVVSGPWLSLLLGGGSSGNGSSSQLTVNESPGSTAGTYYGLVKITAPGATNSPQYLTVVLNVAPLPSPPGNQVYPLGLIFAAPAGGVPTATQQVTVTPQSTAQFVSKLSTTTQSGGPWLNPTLNQGTIGNTITVGVAPGKLSAGVYQGTITQIFGNGAPSQDIGVTFVVAPPSCTATSLVISSRQLGNSFSATTGWPVVLEAQVMDSCGKTPAAPTVVATFSNGDPPLTLTPLTLNSQSSGIYSATWKPGNVAASTTVTLQAFQSPLASARVVLNGQVTANSPPPPLIPLGGVVNGASFAAGADVAPGEIVSVFGTNLAASDNNQAGLPLPTTLAGAKLIIGGIDAPLFYSSTGQVNAQIPFEMIPGSQPQVVAHVISAAGVESDAVPETISIGAAHPGIFLAAESGAPNQGAILNAANVLVDAANPTTAGSVIVIFATGLGATTPASATGQPAATGSVNVPVSVNVGTVAIPAANIQYAGPTPTYVGLYQVNVVLPPGIAPGPTVPVMITQNGVASNMATIAVH